MVAASEALPELQFLDIGGGYGVAYRDGQRPLDLPRARRPGGRGAAGGVAAAPAHHPRGRARAHLVARAGHSARHRRLGEGARRSPLRRRRQHRRQHRGAERLPPAPPDRGGRPRGDARARHPHRRLRQHHPFARLPRAGPAAARARARRSACALRDVGRLRLCDVEPLPQPPAPRRGRDRRRATPPHHPARDLRGPRSATQVRRMSGICGWVGEADPTRARRHARRDRLPRRQIDSASAPGVGARLSLVGRPPGQVAGHPARRRRTWSRAPARLAPPVASPARCARANACGRARRTGRPRRRLRRARGGTASGGGSRWCAIRSACARSTTSSTRGTFYFASELKQLLADPRPAGRARPRRAPQVPDVLVRAGRGRARSRRAAAAARARSRAARAASSTSRRTSRCASSIDPALARPQGRGAARSAGSAERRSHGG